MKVRMLDPSEWGPLEAHAHQLAPHLGPENAEVLVLEDDSGKVVGCLTLARVTFLDAWWMAPEMRGNPRAFKLLAGAALERAKEHGDYVYAGETSWNKPAEFLMRMGAKLLPWIMFELPLKGGDVWHQHRHGRSLPQRQEEAVRL